MVSLFFLTKGVDFTGLGTATAADHNNLVDNSLPYSEDANTGKGLVITSTDNNLLQPDVPDGTTHVEFTKGIWIRRPYNTVANQVPKVYAWNDTLPLDATLQKWTECTVSLDVINALLAPINTTATNALDTANNALAVANNVQAVATAASNDASEALTTANDANSNVNDALNAANAATAAVTTLTPLVTAAQTTATTALTAANNPKALINVASDAATHRGQAIEVDLNADTLAYRDKKKDYILLVEAHAAGVNAGNVTPNAANLRPINTKLQDPGNWITITPGNKIQFNVGGQFRFNITVPGTGGIGSVRRATLEDDTTNVIQLYGTSSYCSVNGGYMQSIITGVVTVVAGQVLRVMDNWGATVWALGLGQASNLNGWTEYYTQVEMWRV